jgi:hypothetical protein
MLAGFPYVFRQGNESIGLLPYSFGQPVAAQPLPQHISTLTAGMQLKVMMKRGFAVEKQADGTGAVAQTGRRASAFSRTTFYAFVLSNNPVDGILTVNIDTGKYSEPTYVAVIPYVRINMLFRIIPSGRPVVETAPVSHPGAQALGTKMSALYPQFFLIRVKF